jgi:hypothetical protein
MKEMSVSVIVASRDRPEALALCLTALGQQRYALFEVIVVACEAGIRAARAHPLSENLKIAECSEANLSVARNVGLSSASGEIVAFIDDDAIAEPFWLAHLIHPFIAPEVMAAGGYVTGRNGISLQWGARSVDPQGWHHEISLEGPDPVVFSGSQGRAVRTEGTNMAIRRAALAELGGFDTSYAFYMDDTDLNMRLFREGLATALVPRARVWHRQLASQHRGTNREPRSLREIGRSLARFLSLYCPPDQVETAIDSHRGDQRRRLLQHMVAGRIMPDDVPRLLREFDEGCASPRIGGPGGHQTGGVPFQRLPTEDPSKKLNVESRWCWARSADDAVRPDWLFRLSPTALFHKVSYQEDGSWLQKGGLWGRSDRNGPLFQRVGFDQRIQQESEEGALSRQFSPFVTNW